MPRFTAFMLLTAACAPALPPAAPDIDRDGVADTVDRCPGETEDGIGPLSEDGCPHQGES